MSDHPSAASRMGIHLFSEGTPWKRSSTHINRNNALICDAFKSLADRVKTLEEENRNLKSQTKLLTKNVTSMQREDAGRSFVVKHLPKVRMRGNREDTALLTRSIRELIDRCISHISDKPHIQIESVNRWRIPGDAPAPVRVRLGTQEAKNLLFRNLGKLADIPNCKIAVFSDFPQIMNKEHNQFELAAKLYREDRKRDPNAVEHVTRVGLSGDVFIISYRVRGSSGDTWTNLQRGIQKKFHEQACAMLKKEQRKAKKRKSASMSAALDSDGTPRGHMDSHAGTQNDI